MKPEQRYEEMCKKLDEEVKCWDDLYTYFDVLAAEVRENPGPITLMNGFFMLYAFVLAMRDLPDEGDALVLAKKMMHNLCVDSEAVLGFPLTVGTAEELMAARLKDAISAIAAVAGAAAQAQDTPQAEAGSGTQQKRVLH